MRMRAGKHKINDEEGEQMDNLCSQCAYLIYDDEMEEYVCDVRMDEDDYYRLVRSDYRQCPYYRNGDEYQVVKKQM